MLTGEIARQSCHVKLALRAIVRTERISVGKLCCWLKKRKCLVRDRHTIYRLSHRGPTEVFPVATVKRRAAGLCDLFVYLLAGEVYLNPGWFTDYSLTSSALFLLSGDLGSILQKKSTRPRCLKSIHSIASCSEESSEGVKGAAHSRTAIS